MRKLLTPKQVARAIGVSEASLKRWCDRELIATQRTAGGHRRIPLSAVVEFVRSSEHQVIAPEALGLPATSGKTEAVLDRAVPRLCEALVTGHEENVRAVLFDLYLADHTIAAIGDKVVRPAFREVGHGWEAGDVEVYQEHRGTEIMLRALHSLAAALTPPAADAPLAVGGTIVGDPYRLPITLIELTLREHGWRAQSLGPNHPVATLINAVKTMRPQLLWLSVSWFRARDEFAREFADVSATCRDHHVPLIVGGEALTDAALREQLSYTAYCDSLAHLEGFLETFKPRGSNNQNHPPANPGESESLHQS